MFRLAHLSDPHLAPLPRPNPLELMSKRGLGYINWLRKRRSIHRPEVLATLIADLKTQSPDHIAVTGDLVNLSLTNEFEPARAWLGSLGDPRDVTAVPGNHDAYVRAAANSAVTAWKSHMTGDKGESFPFVRRRGQVALIGLSTSLPTLPLAATGTLHGDQVDSLAEILFKLGREIMFRIVLIHHPPTEGANWFRRLTNAPVVREVLRLNGAELVLHGHHHESSLSFLPGLYSRAAAVGVPSASGAPGHHEESAGYNIYEIGGPPGAWDCTMIRRGLRADGTFGEIGREQLKLFR
jgi:3',5'-cyclic AMP phosphodiesterase CpdA